MKAETTETIIRSIVLTIVASTLALQMFAMYRFVFHDPVEGFTRANAALDVLPPYSEGIRCDELGRGDCSYVFGQAFEDQHFGTATTQ